MKIIWILNFDSFEKLVPLEEVICLKRLNCYISQYSNARESLLPVEKLLA